MPELPEVENIRRQIRSLAGATITKAHLSSFALRYSPAPSDLQELSGSRIGAAGPERLGRYLLLPLVDKSILMMHLGMTGSLRLDPAGISRKHDHFCLDLLLSTGEPTTLVYNDPRRFGGACLLSATTLPQARAELRLGEEPTALVEPARLAQLYRQAKPIKPLLMDNALITGIGNIYANEICHDILVSPFRLGSSLGPLDFVNLSRSIHAIIEQAIEQGGSTLRNYAHVDGSSGSAQQHHRVYGKAGALCSRCMTMIQSMPQAGRATFFCPNCQL